MDFNDVAPFLRGQSRSIWFYCYGQYNGVFSPLLSPKYNKVYRMEEGEVKNGKMEGFARQFNLVSRMVYIGYFLQGSPYGLQL